MIDSFIDDILEEEFIVEFMIDHYKQFFWIYFRARLDELRMFLENEGWELCPVKSTFSILQLQVN